MNCLLIFKVN